jgi:hypothetical protein
MADPTPIVPKTILGPFATYGAGLADFTFAAGTITDGDNWVCSGRDLLVVRNTNVGAQTITIVSVDDETNRAGNITAYSLAAGDFAVFGVGLTNSLGWQGTGKKIRITVSHAEVVVAVLTLPAGYP